MIFDSDISFNDSVENHLFGSDFLSNPRPTRGNS